MRVQTTFDAGRLCIRVFSDAALADSLAHLLRGFPVSRRRPAELSINLVLKEERRTVRDLRSLKADGGVQLLGWGPRSVDVLVQHPGPQTLIAGITFGLVRALLPRRGLLLHASCGRKDGLAYVFVGPSGAGKSTVLGNARGLEAMHDDRIAVQSSRSGVVAFCLPQIDNSGRSGTYASARLGGIFILSQASRSWIEELPVAEAAISLARQAVLPPAWSSEGPRALETIWGWIARGLVHRLHFSRRADVTALVEGCAHG